ncbi:hypothetical protein NH340_JMT06739 [Sarcoptes scabiei]|nr:hypothetical protein NH340_JMT06739 [Sarcoptes scabiei]
MLNLKLFRSIQSRSKLNDILFEFKTFQSISRFLSQNNNSSFAEFELFPEDLSAEQAYYYNETNQQQILNNIKSREIEDSFPELFDRNLSIEELGNRLVKLSKRLPNTFHPIWNQRKPEIYVSEIVGEKRDFDFEAKQAEEILYEKKLLQLSGKNNGKLGTVGGSRSYMMFGRLATLSKALSRWTLNVLIDRFKFVPVVTPNLVYSNFVRACGFEPYGARTQVYNLQTRNNVCLPGTAEILLAAMNTGEKFNHDELPKLYCGLSRCYRAEAKSRGEKSGLYRIHYFDKVEMFGLSKADKSDDLLEEFVEIQKFLFSSLGLHYRVIDMPPNELGLPAYRKYDIEAFMPGRNIWGEISSASNCTDFQSSKLNISYHEFSVESKNSDEKIDLKRNFVHTVNGTACAIPRMLIALIEQGQTENQLIQIPKVLQPYINFESI